MLAPERMLGFSELFNKWLLKASLFLKLPQNLADYSPKDGLEIHTKINAWLEDILNEKTDSTVGKAFRRLSVCEVRLCEDSDKAIIIIETKGGARSSFLNDCNDTLLDLLEHLCEKKSDIQVYQIGTFGDIDTGIKITGETATKIFELAGVAHQVKYATEKVLTARGDKRSSAVTPVSP